MSGESNATASGGIPTYRQRLKFGDTAFKSQISRVVPLTDETKDLNKRFQAVLGDTVWKNLHAAHHAMAERIPLLDRRRSQRQNYSRGQAADRFQKTT